MLVKFDSRRQSDAYQIKQDAWRSANGGLKNHQVNRGADNRPLTPDELEQIRIAHKVRELVRGTR